MGIDTILNIKHIFVLFTAADRRCLLRLSHFNDFHVATVNFGLLAGRSACFLRWFGLALAINP